MSKSIPSALQTAIQAEVTALATCIEIKRRDGRVYRVTDHVSDLTYNGEVYSAAVPFKMGTIDSSSNLAVDNTELELFLDGTTFSSIDFRRRKFENARITIFWINIENPADGRMVARRGWFGDWTLDQHNHVKITIFGLMKILDFEVVRVYQPLCDADFGDKRCKIAVNQSQIWSHRNTYSVGDWVYAYDTGSMTAFSLTNPSFETDGDVTVGNPITGWTQSTPAYFRVATASGGASPLSPTAGSRALFGATDGTPDDSGQESSLHQDIDLTPANTTDLDDGKISFAVFMNAGQYTNGNSGFRLFVDVLDANGVIIDYHDTDYIFPSVTGDWDDYALAFPLIEGARTARVYIAAVKIDDTVARVGVDNIRAYWWDHTLGNPYNSRIHKLERIISPSENNQGSLLNQSFEADGLVSNALDPTITGWTVTGYGRVVSSLGVLSSQDGARFLACGDNGVASQHTMTAVQTIALADMGVSLSRVLLSKIAAKFRVLVGFDDISLSSADVTLEWLDASNVVQQTDNVLTAYQKGSTGWETHDYNVLVPVDATQVRVTLTGTSPVGVGDGRVAFDFPRFYFIDTPRPLRTDALSGEGDAATVFSTTVDDITFDGDLIWRAFASYVLYDVVASVTDDKTFVATGMTGGDDVFRTGQIVWLSGNNAGTKNVIRLWDGTSKQVKTYFRQPGVIQTGDRFMYIRGCQKRIVEDCKTTFNNVINFRGFPHIPGRIVEGEES